MNAVGDQIGMPLELRSNYYTTVCTSVHSEHLGHRAFSGDEVVDRLVPAVGVYFGPCRIFRLAT